MQCCHLLSTAAGVVLLTLTAGCALQTARAPGGAGPLLIQVQGSFAAGGSELKASGQYDNKQPTAAGQSVHGDHLYAFYQVPQPPRPWPIAITIDPAPSEQLFFDQFRFGKWPHYFDYAQINRKPESLEQFFRSVTPNTGPYDAGVIADAISAMKPLIRMLKMSAGGHAAAMRRTEEHLFRMALLSPGSRQGCGAVPGPASRPA